MAAMNEEVNEELKKATTSHDLCVAHFRLNTFPQQLFLTPNCVDTLRRLDVSFNYIEVLPKEIGLLTNLRTLLVGSNPITCLPEEIASLTKIEEMDIRNTRIAEVPLVVSVLKELFDLDWRDTPMAADFKKRYNLEPCDLHGLKHLLKKKHERETIEQEFTTFLENVKFVKDGAEIGAPFKDMVAAIVRTCSDMFEDNDQFRTFFRRQDNFLPKMFHQYNKRSLAKAKEEFIAFQRETQRKCLAGDLEIKLRQIYFDRIERSTVANMISSIYKHVELLEDVQFLIKYATTVLPPSPSDDGGETVWNNILDLQNELTTKRQNAINSVTSAMMQLYPEQEEPVLKERARDVCRVYQVERFATKKEINSLSQLAADAPKIFPPDFLSVDPQTVAVTMKNLYK
jgi:hypothetical protein